MVALQQVADHLTACAKARTGDEADAFGRSAFNRYYYATFLTTRDLLVRIDSAWAKTRHAHVPTVLEQDLLKRVRTTVKGLEARGILAHGRGRSLINQANAASGDIASILRSAYEVRRSADYAPEERVVFEPTGFRLATHSDVEAKNWVTRVERAKGILINVSKELGLV